MRQVHIGILYCPECSNGSSFARPPTCIISGKLEAKEQTRSKTAFILQLGRLLGSTAKMRRERKRKSVYVGDMLPCSSETLGGLHVVHSATHQQVKYIHSFILKEPYVAVATAKMIAVNTSTVYNTR